MEKITCAERIRAGLELRNLKSADLCKMTEISKSTMSQYLSGLYDPSQLRTELIARALNVNEAWLMGYDVPMQREKPTPVSEDGLDAEKRAFIEKLKSMNPETVAALNKIADSIIAKRDE